jgi:hypothetical protein
VHVLERVVGLEPTLSRWQRAVLATGRYPHGLRERTRTPANDVRSVGARPWDAEILLVGAGDGSRTRVSGLEAHRAATTPHPLSSRALHHRTRGRLELWRPWLKSNQQHAVLETAAAPPPHGRSPGPRDADFASWGGIWGDRRDSNSLAADSQSARAPYCVRPPYKLWSHRPDSNGHHRATRAVVCRLTYGGSTNWSHRRESNALLPHYQCGVQPAELRRLMSLARTTGLEPARTCLRNRALPLAHRPHTPLAEPTGFEPAISCVTGRRGRPDSSMTPDLVAGARIERA